MVIDDIRINKLNLCAHIEKSIAFIKKPAIIGINGAITSGKTVLAHNLEQYLKDKGYNTQIIHIDDFYNPRSVRMKDTSPEHYFKHAIDTQRFSELMAGIKQGLAHRTMTLLDMGTDTYISKKEYIVDKNTVVIVEGVLLFCPAISHFFDYKIYLDIDEQEILRRGKERDVPLYGEDILRQYTDLFIPVQRIYETVCAPKEQSDLIVDNNNTSRPIIIG